MADTGVNLARECALWALPPNSTCAGVARKLLRQALERVGLPEDQIYDATLAVNELAANVYMHVLDRGMPAGDPRPPLTGGPELWVYRRGQNEDSQIVCKVFDPQREVNGHVPTQARHAHELQEHGRGLSIVKALSKSWGCHLTRSRIGGQWSIPGKAVWFAMPIPPRSARPPIRLTPARAARTLQGLLAERGIPRAVLCDGWGQSVLSVRGGLTVWCRSEAFSWSIDGERTRCAFSDLTEAAEQLVRLHEELTLNGAAPHPAAEKT